MQYCLGIGFTGLGNVYTIYGESRCIKYLVSFFMNL